MKVPFWKETYEQDNLFTFRGCPNNAIIAFEYLFKKSWSILDVGCGDGINSLYLAKQGFENIEAFDISENAVNKLNRLAQKDNLNIKSYVSNLCDFTFKSTYDLIISFGVLHFVSKENWKQFIADAKIHTNIGGFHIIQLFTNKVPVSPDIAPFAVGLANEEEIKELYEDWDIVQFKSYVFEEEHPDVPKHQHASNKIIAKRIK